MQRNEDIKQRLQGYPSYISKEQLCKICHISKRTALRLLEDGSIPCKSNGKQTRKFQIALAGVLMDKSAAPEQGILHHAEGVDLIPSNISLSGMETSLVNAMSREKILKQYLDTVKEYDYILLDCMPSLGMLTVNTLAATDGVIIPVQAQYLSAKGMEQLLQTVGKVRRQINPKLKIAGVLLTMVDQRTNYAREVSDLLRRTYGGKIRAFSTDIPHSVRAAETDAESKSIYLHDPKGKVAQAYARLTKEVIQLEKQRENIRLSSLDALFSTEETRQEAQADAEREKVRMIPLDELHPFAHHPFKVKDDEAMQDTVESVKAYGVLVPAIARPQEEGGYELVAGHRRRRASLLAGLAEMPVIVREMDNDEAAIIMVDSNLQRETLLPSERAFAYRMKLEAIRRQAGRPAKNSRQVVGNFESADIVGKDIGESGRQIQRFIRLTYLVPPLLDMVDEHKVAFNPAVELSYLTPDEQTALLDAMDSEQATPSLSQAQRLKKFSQEGCLSEDVMRAILSEDKEAGGRQDHPVQ